MHPVTEILAAGHWPRGRRPGPYLNARTEVARRMRLGDACGIGQIAGLKKQQRGDGMGVERGVSADAGPQHVRRKNPWLEPMSGRVLRASPGRHFLLTACEVGFGQRARALAEKDHEIVHGGEWGRGRG